MKSFMSAALQNAKAPNGATECNSCNGDVVRTTGQESNQPTATEEKPAPTQPPQNSAEKAVVVMQGPLGTAITEALNKSLSKKNNQSPVQVPGVANESFAINYVQANGQINDPKNFIAKVTKAVGLLPAVSNEPTVINTLIDCASKVDDVDFIMVNKVEADPSVPMQKSIITAMNSDGTPGMEDIAIESMQVIVTYRKVAKG